MNYTLKLIIPAGLGIAAAAINWTVLSSRTAPVHLVTVTKPVDFNDTISVEMLKPLPLPRQLVNAELKKSIVTFKDRGLLSGRKARRTIQPGDPIFLADTDLGGVWVGLDPGEELFLVSLDDVSADPELLRIGNLIRFRVPASQKFGEDAPQWLGPFRIVAVGNKVSNLTGKDRFRSGRNLTVGIAYKKNSQQVARLEEFCDDQQLGKATMLGIRVVEGT